MNTNLAKKNINVLCVGGKMRGEGSGLHAEDKVIRFFMQSQHEQDGEAIQGVLESEIKEADALLLFLGGSGWDWRSSP